MLEFKSCLIQPTLITQLETMMADQQQQQEGGKKATGQLYAGLAPVQAMSSQQKSKNRRADCFTKTQTVRPEPVADPESKQRGDVS